MNKYNSYLACTSIRTVLNSGAQSCWMYSSPFLSLKYFLWIAVKATDCKWCSRIISVLTACSVCVRSFKSYKNNTNSCHYHAIVFYVICLHCYYKLVPRSSPWWGCRAWFLALSHLQYLASVSQEAPRYAVW